MTVNNYDPRAQPDVPGFLGDYQDVSWWSFPAHGNMWNSAWIRTYQSDVVATGIQ